MSFKETIYLIYLLPGTFSDYLDQNEQLYRSILPCFEWGLHGQLCHHNRGGLLHTPFHPYHKVAVLFCCTFLGVTSTGRYPAPCSVKPGLSSAEAAISHPTSFVNLSYTGNIDPPINSRTRELFAISSGGTGKK